MTPLTLCKNHRCFKYYPLTFEQIQHPLVIVFIFFLQFKPSSLVLTHRVRYYSNIVNNMCMGYLGLFWYWNWCIIAWLPLSPPPKIYLKIFGFNKLDFFFIYIYIVKVRCVNLYQIQVQVQENLCNTSCVQKTDCIASYCVFLLWSQKVAWQLYQQRLVLAPLINKDSIYVLIFK